MGVGCQVLLPLFCDTIIVRSEGMKLQSAISLGSITWWTLAIPAKRDGSLAISQKNSSRLSLTQSLRECGGYCLGILSSFPNLVPRETTPTAQPGEANRWPCKRTIGLHPSCWDISALFLAILNSLWSELSLLQSHLAAKEMANWKLH